jgi:hypothetical protein
MNPFILKKIKKATSETLVFTLLFSVLSPFGNLIPSTYAIPVFTSIGSFTASGTVANATSKTIPAVTFAG